MIGSPFLEGLAGEDVRAVVGAATTRRFRAQAIIYEQARPASQFFMLTTGRARFFFAPPDGRKIILRWMGPGDVLGVATLLVGPSLYRVSAETVQDSSLLIWSRQTIRALLDRYPRLGQNAVSAGVRYLDWYIESHIALVSDTARQRLASVLAHLADAIGHEVSGGVELQVTNEELASAAHVTPFTASRILGEWQTNRALTKGRGRIVLRSPARLFRTA